MDSSRARRSSGSSVAREWIAVAIVVVGFLIAWGLLDSFQSLRFVVAAGAVLLLFHSVRMARIEERMAQIEAELQRSQIDHLEEQTESAQARTELWQALNEASDFGGEVARWTGEISDRVNALEAASAPADGQPDSDGSQANREEIIRLMEALKATLARKQLHLVPPPRGTGTTS